MLVVFVFALFVLGYIAANRYSQFKKRKPEDFPGADPATLAAWMKAEKVSGIAIVLTTLGLFVGMMIGFGVLEVIFEVKQSREPEIKVWTNRLFFAGVGIFVVMLVASALLGSYAAWRKAKAGVKWPPKT